MDLILTSFGLRPFLLVMVKDILVDEVAAYFCAGFSSQLILL